MPAKNLEIKLYVKRKLFYVFVLGMLINCSSDTSDDAIPYVPFPEIVINLALPENFSLQADKSFKTMGGGVKGIIVYRANASTFNAFERNCSYSPLEACATVEVHSSGLYMHDTCCGSRFEFNGNPSGGPAWRPLRQYEARLSGNTLTITDEVIN